jgi:hypothetical protein
VQKLEDQLGASENGPDEEIMRAKEVLGAAKRVLEEGA